MLGDLPAIAISGHRAAVALTAAWVVQILPVVAHGEYQLVGHQPFVHQIQGQGVRHLPHHQPGFLEVVGTLQDLPGDDTFVLRLIGFHVRNSAGLPAPGMVDQNLRIDAEQPVQQFLAVVISRFADGTPGDVAHGI